MKTRTIEIGALSVPLSKQLEGLVSDADAKQLDADNGAITRCYIMGYIPEAATTRARKKLLKKCQEVVDKHRAKMKIENQKA